jgi:hypothetical protein
VSNSLAAIFVHFVAKKIGLGYFRYLQMIEYCRLKIEYLRNSVHFNKEGAKRHPQIFNLQSSIPACPG